MSNMGIGNIWRGQQYDAFRLLLLGESAYSWIENGEMRHPSPRHAIELVEWVINDFPANSFMNTLTRGLAAEEWPSKTKIESAWARAAFTNYIEETVGMGPRVRPTPAAWKMAKESFPGLLNSVRPKNIIVLGKTMWREMPDADIWLTDDVQGYRLLDGKVAMCWALNHPSAGLSWSRLAAVIKFACEREIVP